MKQTAVEWLFDNLDLSGGSEAIETLKKAKEMEKKQIKDAWINSLTTADYHSSEQYYKETFKSE
jgi:hypothetical protein